MLVAQAAAEGLGFSRERRVRKAYAPDFFGRRISITGISELPGETIGRARWLISVFRLVTNCPIWSCISSILSRM
jgi:hypothetical protein